MGSPSQSPLPPKDHSLVDLQEEFIETKFPAFMHVYQFVLVISESFAGNKILSSHFSFFNILYIHACLSAKSFPSYLTLHNPMDYSLPGYSVHGILQARILEWISCPPGDLSDSGIGLALLSPEFAGGCFTTSATWEALYVHTHTHMLSTYSLLLNSLTIIQFFPV